MGILQLIDTKISAVITNFSSFSAIGFLDNTKGSKILSLTESVSNKLKSGRQSLTFSRKLDARNS